MADVLVTCTRKTSQHHESITHLGGPGGGGCRTKAEVIQSIESRTNTFYTDVGNNKADLRVVQGATGKYLQTYGDSYPNNNLLALPDCG